MILVRRSMRIRQDWRVEFVCGGRAEKAARRDFALLRESAEELSCAQEEVVSALGRVLAERDTHFKNYRELLERLAAAEAALVLQSTPADSEGIRVIDRVFSDMQPEFLGLLDRKSTRLNSSHGYISYAVFCLKKKNCQLAC